MNLLCLWTTWMWKYTSFKSIVTNLESETWWFSSSASWTSLCKGKNSDAADPKWVSGRRPSLEQGSNSWRTLVRCPTEVFPLSLLSVGGRKTLAVEQKPWRRCFRSLGGAVYYCQLNQGSRFKVQGSLLFVTYTIIQGIIGSEMLVNPVEPRRTPSKRGGFFPNWSV